MGNNNGKHLLPRNSTCKNVRAPTSESTKAPLVGYRLDFNGYTQRWGGAVATIIPDEGRHVWGSLWEINLSDMGDLDRQEGVESGIYEPIVVEVETPQGSRMEARTYQYIKDPPPLTPGNHTAGVGDIWRALPVVRRPSPEYRRVIIIGAIETGLPSDYIDALEMIPHNNYSGSSGLGIIPLEEFHRTGALAATS